MLVLARKVHEHIVIGDNIRVYVKAIEGKRVKLGIIAPKEVVIDRSEVRERRKTGFSKKDSS